MPRQVVRDDQVHIFEGKGALAKLKGSYVLGDEQSRLNCQAAKGLEPPLAHTRAMREHLADLELGQRWRSRDARDRGRRIVEIVDIDRQQRHVIVRNIQTHRESKVSNSVLREKFRHVSTVTEQEQGDLTFRTITLTEPITIEPGEHSMADIMKRFEEAR